MNELYMLLISHSPQSHTYPVYIGDKDVAQARCKFWADLYIGRVHPTHNGYVWNEGQLMCAAVEPFHPYTTETFDKEYEMARNYIQWVKEREKL